MLQPLNIPCTSNALILACGKAGGVSEAVDGIAKIDAAGITPTAKTFSALIRCAYTRKTSKGLCKAFEVAAKMRAARMTPTAIAFSALPEACHNAGNIGKGAEVAAEMEAAGFSPNAATDIGR